MSRAERLPACTTIVLAGPPGRAGSGVAAGTLDDAATALAALLDAPVLATGAGHDAGILSARLPTAMLFVRNPTGISHSPEEHAEADDCRAGIDALARVVEELAC